MNALKVEIELMIKKIEQNGCNFVKCNVNNFNMYEEDVAFTVAVQR